MPTLRDNTVFLAYNLYSEKLQNQTTFRSYNIAISITVAPAATAPKSNRAPARAGLAALPVNTGSGAEDDQETEADVMVVVPTVPIVATGAVPAT